MTDQAAKDFITEVFDLIKKATKVVDLETIPDQVNIPIKNRMVIDGYPKIEFNIQRSEIQSLIDKNIIDRDLNFSIDISSKLTDTLSKIFYATAWKKGDLKKIKHIIRGILDSDAENNDQDEALVFYQFGKYLTKTHGQPIIDQHVIRAFAVFTSPDLNSISKLRQLETLNKSHKTIIDQYKKWLISNELTQELRNEVDYTYHIDKLLFAAGKTIKIKTSLAQN